MIDRNIIAATAKAIDALDLSAANERIAQLEAEIGRLETAAETGLARAAEIAATIAERNHPLGSRDVNPGAVADALFASLDTAAAVKASPSVDELQKERDALRGGVTELRNRARQASQEIEGVRRQANKRVAELAQPLVDAIGEEARAAALRIVEAFAALQAIGAVTKSHSIEAQAVGLAMSALAADYGLWSRTTSIDVPAEIVAALAPLGSKGSALRPALLRSIAR